MPFILSTSCSNVVLFDSVVLKIVTGPPYVPLLKNAFVFLCFDTSCVFSQQCASEMYSVAFVLFLAPEKITNLRHALIYSSAYCITHAT